MTKEEIIKELSNIPNDDGTRCCNPAHVERVDGGIMTICYRNDSEIFDIMKRAVDEIAIYDAVRQTREWDEYRKRRIELEELLKKLL